MEPHHLGPCTVCFVAKDLSKEAAFSLLDAVVGYQPGAAPGPDNPMNVAVRRLNDVPGLVTVTESNGQDPMRVDVSPIVNGAIVSTYVLAFWLAQERGVDIEEIFAELRATHEQLGND